VAVMYKGAVVEAGPSESVVGDPLHPYSRALIAAIPGIGKEIRPPERVEEWPFGGCPYAPRCPARTGRCKEAPPLLPVAPDRDVACWNAREGGR